MLKKRSTWPSVFRAASDRFINTDLERVDQSYFLNTGSPPFWLRSPALFSRRTRGRFERRDDEGEKVGEAFAGGRIATGKLGHLGETELRVGKGQATGRLRGSG